MLHKRYSIGTTAQIVDFFLRVLSYLTLYKDYAQTALFKDPVRTAL